MVFAGLAPSEQVEVTFETGTVAGRSASFAAVALPTTVVAGRDGVATVTVTVPAALGPQTIQVRGLSTGRTGSLGFVVVAAAPGGGTPGAVTPGGQPGAGGVGSGSPTGAGAGDLPGTGLEIAASAAIAALAAVTAGVALLLRRSRTA